MCFHSNRRFVCQCPIIYQIKRYRTVKKTSKMQPSLQCRDHLCSSSRQPKGLKGFQQHETDTVLDMGPKVRVCFGPSVLLGIREEEAQWLKGLCPL